MLDEIEEKSYANGDYSSKWEELEDRGHCSEEIARALVEMTGGDMKEAWRMWENPTKEEIQDILELAWGKADENVKKGRRDQEDEVLYWGSGTYDRNHNCV